MKLKYNLSIIAVSTIMLATLPLSAFAATKVSRQFNSDFFYFPQTSGAVVFSGGSFYQSSDPTVGNWSTATIDVKTVDGFSGTSAVTLKHHAYALGKSDSNSVPTKIVRMKTNQPTQLNVVKNLSSNDEFYSLVKYQGALYASDAENSDAITHLFRSTDGTHWHTVQTSGLPAQADLHAMVAGQSGLYAFNDGSIYSSTDGKAWTKLVGPYNDASYYGRVESFVEFSDNLYVLATDDVLGVTDVWKLGNQGNFTQVFEKTTDTFYTLYLGANTLYMSGTDGGVRTLGNDQFTVTDNLTSQAQGVITSNDQDLFMVSDSGNISLWK